MFEQINEKYESLFNFMDEKFIYNLNNEECKDIVYGEETFRLYMLVKDVIKNINDEIKVENCLNWGAYNYFKNYLKGDLNDKWLNKLLLDLFCYKGEKKVYYSNPFTIESAKKLMRVVEVSNEFYFENIDKLKNYYNILKRNNPNLKEDDAKLVTLIEKEPSSLEDEIDNKYNLSSKKVLGLPTRYFLTHYYHFNWWGLKSKYRDEITKLIVEGFKSDTFFTGNKFREYDCIALFDDFINGNDSISIDDKAKYFVKIKIEERKRRNYTDIRDFLSDLNGIFNISKRFDNEDVKEKLLPEYARVFKDAFKFNVDTNIISDMRDAMTGGGYYYSSRWSLMVSKAYKDTAPDPQDIAMTEENFKKYLIQAGVKC